MIFHSAAPYMLERGELCSVSGGIFVLSPSDAEFDRAIRHLHTMNRNGTRKSNYDGGDQEFWRSFYPTPVELPIRFHATSYLKMNRTEWREVRLVHIIAGFKNFDHIRVPTFVRNYMKYYK